MNVGVVLLGAKTFLTEVNVFAPAAASETVFFADGAAYCASFKEIGHHMPGVLAPFLHHLLLFPDFRQFVFPEHMQLPAFLLIWMQSSNQGPSFHSKRAFQP